MSVPLPNELLDNSVVIASCYHGDEVEGCVLLLNPEAPYFTVAYVYEDESVVRKADAFNIVGAVKEYVEYGGDPGDDEDIFG